MGQRFLELSDKLRISKFCASKYLNIRQHAQHAFLKAKSVCVSQKGLVGYSVDQAASDVEDLFGLTSVLAQKLMGDQY